MSEEKQDTEEIKREGNPFLRQVSLLLFNNKHSSIRPSRQAKVFEPYSQFINFIFS